MSSSKKDNLYEIIFFVVFVFFMFYKLIVCFPLLGSFMIFKVVDYFLFLKYIQKNGIPHVGEIVSYENDRGYKTPVIAFETTEQHIEQTPQLHVSSDLDKFRSFKKNIGKTVSILYDPKSPEKFILINKGESSYFGLILVFLVGVVFIIVGLGVLLGYINTAK
ncbi:DUF3592 domain-containing protein [Flavobacterium microcysteis]